MIRSDTRKKSNVDNDTLTRVSTKLFPIAFFLLASSGVSAGEPVALSNQTLDGISAGAVSVSVRAKASGKRKARTKVKLSSTAHTSGDYTLETAMGSGSAYACCRGGKTSVKVSNKGKGIKSGGGSVTAKIRIPKRGTYSYGIGVQIALTKK